MKDYFFFYLLHNSRSPAGSILSLILLYTLYTAQAIGLTLEECLPSRTVVTDEDSTIILTIVTA